MNLLRAETIAALCLIAVGCRFVSRTWGNPGSILAVGFLLSLGIQQAFIPSVPFGPLAAAAIGGGPLAVAIGALLARRAPSTVVDSVVEIIPERQRICNYAIWTVTAVAIWYTWLTYTTIVVDQNNYINHIFYRQAFSAGVGGGAQFRISQAVMYVGAVLMALDILARGLLRWAPLTFIACVAVQSYVASTKSPTLITLALLACLWIGARQASTRRILRTRNLAVLVVVVVAALCIVSAVTQRRAGGRGDVPNTIAYSYGGPPSALSEVLDGGFDSGLRGGAATIGGLREALGGVQRGSGAGLNSVYLTPGVSRSNINVYTWYLPLLADLGPFGMVLALALLGYWAGALGQQAARGAAGVPRLVVFALLLTMFLWAPILAISYFNFWFLLLVLAPAFGLLYRVSDAPIGVSLEDSRPAVRWHGLQRRR